MEVPVPTGSEARKLDPEEILEVLENRIPTTWKFQMDKEDCKSKTSEKASTACKRHSERGGKRKAKHKASKNVYHDWALSILFDGNTANDSDSDS
eukprot:15122774-Ditylum_brightwellii.AAC.1